MDDKTLDLIFANIRTLEEAYRLDDEFRIVQRESYNIKTNDHNIVLPLAERIKDQVSLKMYNLIGTLEEKNIIVSNNPDLLEQFFANAHKEIMKMPRFQLQVAIELQEQMLDTIYAWVKKEINTRFFLDVIAKPTILAGCVMVYRGIFRDYSLHTLLHDNKTEIFKPIMEKVGSNQG